RAKKTKRTAIMPYPTAKLHCNMAAPMKVEPFYPCMYTMPCPPYGVGNQPRKGARITMLEAIYSRQDFWRYVVIPLVVALLAWSTNWIAVQMTFYPIEFFGIRPIFGWQGIIPSKAEKMAGILVDQTLSKIGSIDEFFQQME